MHEVFINYRTGDGDEAAALVNRALSDRFGEERIFRAPTSIAPGEAFPDKLIRAVRRSSVLLAIMGPDWARFPQLGDRNDWVRREILEAYANGIRVIPVLKGRKTDRLNAADLPADLARLADTQSLRLDMHDNEVDLVRMGDRLADLVPSLKEADRAAPGSVESSESNDRGAAAKRNRNTSDAATIIKNARGAVHAGKGDIYQNAQHFSGDGATYIGGDNHASISHKFDGPSRDEDQR